MIASRAGPESKKPLRLGFLLSGTGRSLDNLVAYLKKRPDLAEVVLVISDRESAPGLQRAARFGIPFQVLPCRGPKDAQAIFRSLEEAHVHLVLLAGFLRLLHVPSRWSRRVLNIHPSLIPKFCGQGYHGDRVHEAVLAAGEKVSGCTVHFVDNTYDHGPILLKEKVTIEPQDTVTSLADRVFGAECHAYPKAVELIATERVRWVGDRPVIEAPERPA